MSDKPTSIRKLPKIDIPPHLEVTQEIEEDSFTKHIKIMVTMNEEEGRYTPYSVEIESPDGYLTNESISAPIISIIAEACRPLLVDENPRLVKQYPALKLWGNDENSPALDEENANDPNENLLFEAAVVMQFERIVGGKPVQAVQNAFGITHQQARRWESRIRRRGWL